MSERLEDIRSRLDGIAEELADLAMERLRAAAAAGALKAPADEKQLTRAPRRSVEKAAALVGAVSEAEDHEPDASP